MPSPQSLTKVSQIVSDIYALLRGNGTVMIDENGDIQLTPDIGRKVYIDGTEAVNVAYLEGASGALVKTENLGDLPDAGVARGNLGLGTSATKAAQATPTDISVADAVMIMGSWGIGAGGIGDSGNAHTPNVNTLTNTGMYYTNTAFTGQPAGAGAVGALLHINQLPNANSSQRVWIQMYFDVVGSKIFWRVKPAGTAITAATWLPLFPVDATTLDGEDGSAYLLASRTFSEFNALPSPDVSKLAARTELLGPSGLGEKAKQVDGLAARGFGGKSSTGTQYALTLASGLYYASTINNSVGGTGPEFDVAKILGLPAGSNWFVLNILGPTTGAYSARQLWINAVSGDTLERVLTSATADWKVEQVAKEEVGDLKRTYKTLDNSWLPLTGGTYTVTDYPDLAALFPTSVPTYSNVGWYHRWKRGAGSNRPFYTFGQGIGYSSNQSLSNIVSGTTGLPSFSGYSFYDIAQSGAAPTIAIAVGSKDSLTMNNSVWHSLDTGSTWSQSNWSGLGLASGEYFQTVNWCEVSGEFLATTSKGKLVRAQDTNTAYIGLFSLGSVTGLTSGDLTDVQYTAMATKNNRSVLVGYKGNNAYIINRTAATTFSGQIITDARIHDVVYDPQEAAFFAVGYATTLGIGYATIWKSTNGTTWTAVYTSPTAGTTFNAITLTYESVDSRQTGAGQRTLVAAGTNGIWKSHTGANGTWITSITNGIVEGFATYAGAVNMMSTDSHLVIVATVYNGYVSNTVAFKIKYVDLITEDALGFFTLPTVTTTDGGPTTYIKAKRVKS